MKPLTMTLEHEGSDRRIAATKCEGPGWTLRGPLLRAHAEIDALRRLPVISTCGDCARVGYESGDVVVCAHDAVERDGDDVIDQSEAPPAWCPLRNAR